MNRWRHFEKSCIFAHYWTIEEFRKNSRSRLRLEYEKIVGNGGVKSTRTHEEDETLNGYVISLQKLDALLKADIKKGLVRIEKTEIIGVDDKEYDL